LAVPSDGRSRAAGGALSAASLEAVLRLLDADRERAGLRYETIRRKLIRFFECRGCAHADELADETIDRVGGRLGEGEQVRNADAGAYFHGVARNVLRESWRPRRTSAPGVAPSRVADGEETLAERRLRCLDACLAALPPDERQLILWYYQAGEQIHIEARKDLAGTLGIGMNALRIRAHRIRGRLEECVRARLAAEIESGPAPRVNEESAQERTEDRTGR
jgi:DNA-directed RNA polymerase specialized sigma24 family protein